MITHTTVPLLLCATLVLTSSVNKTDTNVSSSDNKHVSSSKNVDASSTVSSNLTKELHKGESDSFIFTEGGSIPRVYSTDLSENLGKNVSMLNKTSEETVDKLISKAGNDSKSKDPKPRNASVVGRKGAVPSPKIMPRKGVGPELSPVVESTTESSDEDVLPSSEESANKKVHPAVQPVSEETVEASVKTEKLSHAKVNETKIEAMKNLSQINESTTPSDIKKVSIEAKETEKNETKAKNKRIKPKPTVTVGEMEIDKPIPASPTKTPPLGMPRKIDYIVPVIITIMAVPLLGAATFFLYRRGRDCWDKRHYRRMDFLIDGMYNDYSWK